MCFDADGRVTIVVTDDLADLFDDAAKLGMSADDLLTRFLDEAEQTKVANTNTSPKVDVSAQRRLVICDRTHVELRHGTGERVGRTRPGRRERLFS